MGDDFGGGLRGEAELDPSQVLDQLAIGPSGMPRTQPVKQLAIDLNPLAAHSTTVD